MKIRTKAPNVNPTAYFAVFVRAPIFNSDSLRCCHKLRRNVKLRIELSQFEDEIIFPISQDFMSVAVSQRYSTLCRESSWSILELSQKLIFKYVSLNESCGALKNQSDNTSFMNSETS